MRRRLVLSYLSLTLFVLLALGLPLGLTFANSERRRLVSDVQHDAFALALRADEYVRAHDADDAGRARSAASTSPPTRTLERLSTATTAAPARGRGRRRERVRRRRHVDGRRLDRRVRIAPSPSCAASPSSVGGAAGARGDGGSAPACAPASDARRGGARRLRRPYRRCGAASRTLVGARRAASSDNWLLLLGLSGVIALVVLLVSVLLARSFTKPLAELDEAAARLGEGDLPRPRPGSRRPARAQRARALVQRDRRAARGAAALAAGVRRRRVAPAPDAARRAPAPAREPRGRRPPRRGRRPRARAHRGAPALAARRQPAAARACRAGGAVVAGRRRRSRRRRRGPRRRLVRAGRRARASRSTTDVAARSPCAAHRAGSSRSSTTS